MTRRRAGILISFLGLVSGFGIWVHTSALAEDAPTRSTRTRARTTGTGQADLGRIDDKLDRLLAGQQDLLQRLAEIAQQLQHIKSRSVQ